MHQFAVFCFFFALISAETLRQAATGKHLYIGAAGNAGHIMSGEANYTQTLASEYNLVTAENGCKWAATEPKQGQFDFTQCDAVFRFTRTNGQQFRGHNLCWGVYNPDWLTNGKFTPAEKRSILQNHITNVMKKYGEGAFAWDVVNEAITDQSGTLWKNNVWYPDIPDYVDIAFQTARTAGGPNIKLFYNDYSHASATGWSADKSQRVYDMIKSMKTRGIPIDGVGFQLHVDLNYDGMIQGVRQNLQRYSDLGLEIHMTEIDISCSSSGSCPSWDTTKAQQQAKVYGDLLQACLDFPKCTNFETWGFTDKYSWLTEAEHPLPFDENYSHKPAYNTLLSTLQKS